MEGLKELSDKAKDVGRVREIDRDIKNKFRFEWLNENVTLKSSKLGETKVCVKDSIVKVDVAGKVLCKFCKDLINYKSKGKSAIFDHLHCSKHISEVELRRTNYVISGEASVPKKPKLFPLFNNVKKVTSSDSVQSSSAESVVEVEDAKPTRLVPLGDRTANMEAMITSFMAENNVSFNIAPQLVDLIRECASDTKALAGVKLNRTSATYKLKYGVADFFKQSLVENLKAVPFSMNIDEATASNNNKKVLSVIVAYPSFEKCEIVVEHLASLELTKCDSLTIFEAVKYLLESNNIPKTNLQSCLMDSCSVMRGCKSGFETRLREWAPHLLEIDGDSVHHVHNATKKFCEPFEQWVEKLFNDLYTDFKWTSESKLLMRELCEIFGVKFTVPERFISHRWLSCYDLSLSTIRLYDMFRVFYSASATDISIKQSVAKLISNGVGENKMAEKRVYDILYLLKEKAKTMTKEGKARRARLVEKLFHKDSWTRLILNFYSSALPMLKSYVMTFQTQEPLIHKLHDHQVEVTSKFLACFIKAEKISVPLKKLATLDVDSVDNHLGLRNCFVGKETKILLEACTEKEKTDFLILMNKSYRQAAKHLLKCFPLENSVIRNLSALDPVAPNHSVITKCLQDLCSKFDHILDEKEQSDVLVEVKNFTIAEKKFVGGRADVWWAEQHAFPVLKKVATACLTIFHGPQVERSFSFMKDVMKSKACNMEISTLSAIQTIKYALRARNTTAVECFKRKDINYDPIEGSLIKCVNSSSIKYKANLKKKKDSELEKKEMLNLKIQQLQTKSQAKKIKENAVKQALKAHRKTARKVSAIQERLKEPPCKRRKF